MLTEHSPYSTKQYASKVTTMPYHHRRRSSSHYFASDKHWRDHISAHRRSSIGIGITRRRSSVRFKLDLYDSGEQRSYRIVKPGVEERRPSWADRTFTPEPQEIYTSRAYRVVVPESKHYELSSAWRSWHGYCIAKDSTYARLFARLERMRKHQGFVANLLVRGFSHRGDIDSTDSLLGHLSESVGKLERVLEAMREKIRDGTEQGYDGSNAPFKVDGEWVKFV